MISVIIINFNTPDITKQAISRFINQAEGLNYEIILIDNNSTKKIPGADLKAWRIKFIQNTENLGFAKAVNQGIESASGDYILLLNSDALVQENTVMTIFEYLKNNDKAGIIGPKFVYPDGLNQVSSGMFPNLWREFFRLSMLHRILPFSAYNKNFKTVQEVDWVSGGCMLIKREVINQIGLFDENYFFSAEDMDFCLRAKRRGWQIIYYPLASIVHHYGLSSGGRKATRAVRLERGGFNYFFKKNYPEKKVTRALIWQMHNFKIFMLNLLGYE
jgi:GT2 family glycosyltransferase